MVVIPLRNEQDAKRRRLLSDVDRVAQVISRRQEQEEENNPFFERRQKIWRKFRKVLVCWKRGNCQINVLKCCNV